MRNFVHDMLHNSPAARRIESLWRVRFVKFLAVKYDSLVNSYRNMRMVNRLKLIL